MADSHSGHDNSSHSASAHGHDTPWQWLGDGSLRAQDAEEGLGHIVEISTFNKVFATLVVLTIVTVAVSRVDFGEMNTVIAIVIASIKAGLVATFFMHLKFEKKVIIMYSVYPLIVLFLLIGGSLMDVTERHQVLPFWKPKADLLARPAPVIHDEHGGGEHNGSEGHESAKHE